MILIDFRSSPQHEFHISVGRELPFRVMLDVRSQFASALLQIGICTGRSLLLRGDWSERARNCSILWRSWGCQRIQRLSFRNLRSKNTESNKKNKTAKIPYGFVSIRYCWWYGSSGIRWQDKPYIKYRQISDHHILPCREKTQGLYLQSHQRVWSCWGYPWGMAKGRDVICDPMRCWYIPSHRGNFMMLDM